MKKALVWWHCIACSTVQLRKIGGRCTCGANLLPGGYEVLHKGEIILAD